MSDALWPELVEAAQRDAPPPAPARKGDRYLKAWDIGRKDASVCVVLRVPGGDEPDVLQVVDYQRLQGEDYPVIQRAIKAMHRKHPGPTVIEANSIGKPVIQNLHLPPSELIELTTTAASKQAMLTELEIRLQEQTLKIDPSFQQLLSNGRLGDELFRSVRWRLDVFVAEPELELPPPAAGWRASSVVACCSRSGSETAAC